MDKEYISRGAVLAKLRMYEEYGCKPVEAALAAVEDMRGLISEMPAEDTAPVVHSEWINCKGGNATCKRCGVRQFAVYDDDGEQNFCGHCGAMMDGGDHA